MGNYFDKLIALVKIFVDPLGALLYSSTEFNFLRLVG